MQWADDWHIWYNHDKWNGCSPLDLFIFLSNYSEKFTFYWNALEKQYKMSSSMTEYVSDKYIWLLVYKTEHQFQQYREFHPSTK